jgi:RNA polymerase sigma-70 factor (ECF subfamily)
MIANKGGVAGMSSAPDPNELFERLYGQFADDVLRVSYFYLGDRQKAEDVCQDVFVRLLTRAPEIQPGHEKAWLLKVALNRCRDLWRAAWVKRVVLGSPFDCIPAPDDIEFRTEKTDLMEAVAKLPPAFKEVILLHYYQGFGISEIAMMLDLPEGTISSRLSRARKKLEALLKGGESR